MTKTNKPRRLTEEIFTVETRMDEEWKTLQGIPRLTGSRDSIIEKGLKIWNAIPDDIQIIENDPNFKKKCKEWMNKNIPIRSG